MQWLQMTSVECQASILTVNMYSGEHLILFSEHGNMRGNVKNSRKWLSVYFPFFFFFFFFFDLFEVIGNPQILCSVAAIS